MTGLTFSLSREIYAKQLQLLKEAVPRARRLAVLRNPANPITPPSVRTVEQAVQSVLQRTDQVIE